MPVDTFRCCSLNRRLWVRHILAYSCFAATPSPFFRPCSGLNLTAPHCFSPGSCSSLVASNIYLPESSLYVIFVDNINTSSSGWCMYPQIWPIAPPPTTTTSASSCSTWPKVHFLFVCVLRIHFILTSLLLRYPWIIRLSSSLNEYIPKMNHVGYTFDVYVVTNYTLINYILIDLLSNTGRLFSIICATKCAVWRAAFSHYRGRWVVNHDYCPWLLLLAKFWLWPLSVAFECCLWLLPLIVALGWQPLMSLSVVAPGCCPWLLLFVVASGCCPWMLPLLNCCSWLLPLTVALDFCLWLSPLNVALDCCLCVLLLTFACACCSWLLLLAVALGCCPWLLPLAVAPGCCPRLLTLTFALGC